MALEAADAAHRFHVAHHIVCQAASGANHLQCGQQGAAGEWQHEHAAQRAMLNPAGEDMLGAAVQASCTDCSVQHSTARKRTRKVDRLTSRPSTLEMAMATTLPGVKV